MQAALNAEAAAYALRQQREDQATARRLALAHALKPLAERGFTGAREALRDYITGRDAAISPALRAALQAA